MWILGLFLSLTAALKPLKYSSLESYSDFCSEISTFEAEYDHFSTRNTQKIEIRVITDDRFYQAGGPVLFYTGNEGDVQLFCENTGFMRKAGKELNAKLVFMEHRYYGKSIPDDKNLYLSAEQALADYAEYLVHLKSSGVTGPVIAMGGSYGGMLAAYFRIKYPNLVAGAIAGSAPVKFLPGLFDCRGFYRVTTRTFTNTPSEHFCSDNIRKSWETIKLIGAHMVGKRTLSEVFRTCEPITDVEPLLDFLEDVWGTLAMMDYPYPTNFVGDVPGWPVNVACSHLDHDINQEELLEPLRDAASVYYNYTGDLACLDLGDEGGDLGYNNWYFQTCTEFVFPFCSDGKEDMFRVHTYDFPTYSTNCQQTFGTTPREHWAEMFFSVETMKTIGGIIFSNGLLDPWSSGGVLTQEEAGPRNYIFILSKGAHHLDLRADNPADPEEVTLARTEYISIMKNWIAESISKTASSSISDCSKKLLFSSKKVHGA
ncbi:unnamed protein product [Oikopleura dioica]|uniref:Lysosomal Pro-X carboxypeptidase n=1 Tax=Oikopleura dioica TaxID=34765 RepID=E4YI65_OIKDI|nr:unnamed protein product [Oikopleura dioica]